MKNWGARLPGVIFLSLIIPQGLFEQICGMIMATKIPQSPKNYLEQILCDADLDYLGRDDFYDIGGTLFKELKTYNVLDTEEALE